MMEQQGARKEKRRYWEEQIRRFGESGLTQVEYCRRNQISRDRLNYWRKRLSSGSSSLVEISLNRFFPDVHGCPLRLVIGDRYRIEVDRGFDPGVLHQLLYVLEQR